MIKFQLCNIFQDHFHGDRVGQASLFSLLGSFYKTANT